MTKNAKKRRFFFGPTRNSFLLALISLFADIFSERLYLVLPIFLTQTLKASGGVVGIIEGVAVATQSIAQGPSGWLSDKWQKRKWIAILGYILSAFAKPYTGLAMAWPWVLGTCFPRMGSATRFAPRDALIAASTYETPWQSFWAGRCGR
ncbi:MAG TPA: MFS transporter [Chitinophagaceae bacterium]|nr:MFS transporter [Chitinophagaceae bacterium]